MGVGLEVFFPTRSEVMKKYRVALWSIRDMGRTIQALPDFSRFCQDGYEVL